MIYRCYYCDSVVLPSDIDQGSCPECGAMRVRVAVQLSDAEMQRAVERGYQYEESNWSREKVLGKAT